ncbi:tyrosine-protein phosphatase [Macrococcus capreoli]|uniref:tyrosine-protein phosphatase n=1 Tax=Macrococcus capreoli TaxID=2982690 RepID=UPI003F43748F
MIDLHNHILFGIDDGAQTKEDTLNMARAAQAQGITDIIATPHHKIGVYQNFGPKIKALAEEVNTIIAAEGIPVKVHPSQEIRIYGDVVEDLKSGKALTLTENGPYVLIEFPSNEVPVFTEQLFTKLALEGYIPIIAHPERNTELQKNPNKLAKLIELGALAQVTAGVVCGQLGEYSKQCAEMMMEHRLIHIVASDAHNVTSRNYYMKEAYDVIEQQYGIEEVNKYKENAQKVLAGETIRYVSPLEVETKDRVEKTKKKKKKLFGLF